MIHLMPDVESDTNLVSVIAEIFNFGYIASGDVAFASCNLSGTLSLPNTLMKIGCGSFKSNHISEICFLDGCNLTAINEYAFSNNALKQIPYNIF